MQRGQRAVTLALTTDCLEWRRDAAGRTRQSFPEQSLNLAAQSVPLACVFTVSKGHKWKCPPILTSNSELLYTFLSNRQALVVAIGFLGAQRERESLRTTPVVVVFVVATT